MKNQKGFIQIPILIIIVVGVLTVGGAGYFGYSKYTKSVKNEEGISKQPNDNTLNENDPKKELEELKQEVEKLKNQQKTQTNIPKTTPQNLEGKLSKTLLNEIILRTVRVECSGEISTTGSGFVASSEATEKGWVVLTNAHVVVVGPKYWEKSYCNVIASSPTNSSAVISYPAIIFKVETKKYPDIDYAMLLVPNGHPLKHFKDIMNPVCYEKDIEIGDAVNIFGYPAYGGESVTVTEGIVSGFQTTVWGNVVKTSAKIDSGNSGGMAINVSKKCAIGMPTWVVEGNFSGLGYIQPTYIMSN